MTVSPGVEEDLLRSVLVLAQVAKVLRPSPTVHYQHSPPLQEPDGERRDIRTLEGKVSRKVNLKYLKGTLTKQLLVM